VLVVSSVPRTPERPELLAVALVVPFMPLDFVDVAMIAVAPTLLADTAGPLFVLLAFTQAVDVAQLKTCVA